ncbi:MAG TPA: D-alanyl-D-alanine carboxypeptidase/D-alanyl-D-alanine-endopeptidase [Gemmatimonadales bacterium]|nr:D-alanyl-D-alanine carboxypeptidase/D-alanyl-D-alanine-endopeptidase [Gemmatimonadales bacterium]
MACRVAGALVAAIIIGAVASLPADAQSLAPKELDALQAWYRRTADRTGNGEWGVAVGTMDGRVLWSVSPELALIPASTAKVFTTGFTRTRVGGDGRITTRVVGDGALEPSSGRWQGTWALDLGGDWTLDRAGRSGTTLRELARRLRARGVRQLEGPLVLTSPNGPATSQYPSVWSADFEGQLYAPPVGPVALHENTISLTYRPGRDTGAPPVLVSAYPDGVERLIRMNASTVSGSGGRLWLTPTADGGWTLNGSIGLYRRTSGFSAVAHDPSRLLAAVWASALERAGIRWVMPGGPIAQARQPQSVLAQVESAPFDSVAVEVNRRSLNIGAELMLQWAAGSQTTGPALVTDHVRRVVGPSARVSLVDGSGLSELNRISPMTQMLYLARYPQLPGNERFPLLLPANGTGTLRNLRGGMGRGVVHAKTGTLDNVANLAGYLGRPDGVRVISLMFNGRRIGAARTAEWELFRLLGAEGVDLRGALETQMGGSTTPSDQ